jgi:hypothetical protein
MTSPDTTSRRSREAWAWVFAAEVGGVSVKAAGGER